MSAPLAGRVMALDVGEKNIGVALSDETQLIASPRETVRRDGRELARLKSVAETEAVVEIVVGMPISLNGTHGPAAQAATEFIRLLQAEVTLPIHTWDERLTTVQAERALKETHARRAKRRQVVDQVAATLILQHFLDSRKWRQRDDDA